MFLTSNMVPSGGSAKTTTLVSSGFVNGSPPSGMSNSTGRGTKATTSGTLVANTLKNMLSLSGGAGSMSVCAVHTNDGTVQTIRLQVIVDGSYTVFDVTSASVAATNNGILAAGTTDTSAAAVLFDGLPIHWKTSISVSIASSAAATDKLVFVSKYMLEA